MPPRRARTKGPRGRIEFRTFFRWADPPEESGHRTVADACNPGEDAPRTLVDHPYRSARRGRGVEPEPAEAADSPALLLSPAPKNNGNKGTAAAHCCRQTGSRGTLRIGCACVTEYSSP